jgi:hypothetical protein
LPEEKEDIPSPVSVLTTDFRLSFEDFVLPEFSLASLTSRETRSKAYDDTDIGSGILNAPQNANSSAEYFTSTSELPDDENQDETISENSEGEEELLEDKEEQVQEYEHEEEALLQRQGSSTFPITPPLKTPKTPRDELMALRSGRENMYNQLLRQWKKREESRSPMAPRSRFQTGSGAFSRSVLCTSSQVAPATVSSPQLVSLCGKEVDNKEHTKDKDGRSLTTNPEHLQMKKILTKHSVDSGVYSADGISLSDLE